jgi:hypothetical protein
VNADSALSVGVLLLSNTLLIGCSQTDPNTLVTIADARVHKAEFIDIGDVGDSPGDMFIFDQPLLDSDSNRIGSNSGICVRTLVGHSLQCQWTLTLENGTIQVAGRECDKGTSLIAIVGGTGVYTGISGQMESTNKEDGTFSQVLRYQLP